MLEYKLGRRVSVELGALLVGFYSVVPHQLVSVFLTAEVQLLLSGLPQIDVNDWRFNTLYVRACDTRVRAHFVWGRVRARDASAACLLALKTHSTPTSLRALAR